MAPVEKITYPPLIAHLKEQPDLYNQVYAACELEYGRIEKHLIHSWLVHVVEPIIREATKERTENIPQIFKAFFSELLPLLGSGTGIRHANEYQASWLLCKKIPHLVSASPLRIVKAINSALYNIRRYQPGRVSTWIGLMEDTIPYCLSTDDFLSCGRIHAWYCGLAHLRERSLQTFAVLPQALQDHLRDRCPLPFSGEHNVTRNRINTEGPFFAGEAGGFLGWGGSFTAPPVVARMGNYILATDKTNSYALFADAFGKVLLPGVPVTAHEIMERATGKPLEPFKARYGKDFIAFDDISSCAVKDSTLVLTRYSSHYLYVYGWPDTK